MLTFNVMHLVTETCWYNEMTSAHMTYCCLGLDQVCSGVSLCDPRENLNMHICIDYDDPDWAGQMPSLIWVISCALQSSFRWIFNSRRMKCFWCFSYICFETGRLRFEFWYNQIVLY